MINRREFVASSMTATASLLLSPLPSFRKRVNVTDFGADPEGVADSTAAVRQGIEKLRSSGGTIVFPHGHYTLSAPSLNEPSMAFKDLTDVEIDGDGSTLMFAGFTKPFVFADCRNCYIHDLIVDYPRPPFSQGTVIAVGDRWFDLKVDLEFPVVGGEPVGAFADYDPKTKLMVHDGVDSYGTVKSTTLAGFQTLRVDLKEPVAVREQAVVVLRHQVYGSDVFSIRHGSNFRFAHITLYAAPGMGILADHCCNISVDDLRVDTPPKSTRLMSLTADACHFAECSGTIAITNCRFRAMGDDAINSHSVYWKVNRRVDARTIEVGRRNAEPFEPSLLPHRKDRILVLNVEDCHPIGELSIKSAAVNGPWARLTFAQSLPTEAIVGTLVCNLSNSARTLVENCNFLGNRARAILAHRNVEITGNNISNCSLAGILLTSDPDWMEGPPVQNVRIANNRFSNCYYSWPDSRRGVVTLDLYEDKKLQLVPKTRISQDVQIMNNVFEDTGGAAVYCSATSKLKISDNQLGQTWIGNQVSGDPDAIILVNCADSEVSRNISLSPQNVRGRSCSPTIKFLGNKGLRFDPT